MTIQRISILGVGLLGGSLGMAARAAFGAEIVGYGHRRGTLDKALENGAIDIACEDPAAAVRDADLVVLCTPVGIFPQLVQRIAAALKDGAIVTDVGSTKRSIVAAAEAGLPKTAHFIGSHPMAGSEKRSVEYARADLFVNATCILTPTARTDAKALRAAEAFWQGLRMRIVRLSPEEHDRRLADISHLPHALAAALVAMQEEASLPLCGKGFLDTTRIAGGDGALWRDILLDNADNLVEGLRRLRASIDQLEAMLGKKQGEELSRWLDTQAARREAVLKQKLSEVTPD